MADYRDESVPPLHERDSNRTPIRALLALADCIRDNVFLEDWALDELVDMQPDNTHAKAMLVALGGYSLVPVERCEIAMLERDLEHE